MTPLEVVHAMPSALNRPENRNPQENLQQSPNDSFYKSEFIDLGINRDTDNKLRGHGGYDEIRGYDGNDVIWGDSSNDDLRGDDGDDTLRGGSHRDTLYGGDDDDLLYGETGNDRLEGGDDDDTLYGGDGDDTLFGGEDEDYLKGEEDEDELFGGSGDDTAFGDEGQDTIEGGDGDDLLFGGLGNDLIRGGKDRDRLAGEGGRDSLFGGEDNDYLYGGEHNDTLSGGTGDDVLHGEDGTDTADYSDGLSGVTINLFDETALSSDLGADWLFSIENIIGSEGSDIIDGDHSSNDIRGNGGDDIIRGHNQDDTIVGGAGNDVLWGDEGNDSIAGGLHHDELRGGLGSDTLSGGDGDDHLRGEQSNDTIDGGSGTDTVFSWGEFEDFEIVEVSLGKIRITDLRADGLEGSDTLTNVEFLQFFDRTVSVADLFAPAPVMADDFAETKADLVIAIDAAANDQPNASSSWVSAASVSSGFGSAAVIGSQVIFDPNDQFQHLDEGQIEKVSISYTLMTSGGQSAQGVVELDVVGVQKSLSDTESDFTGDGSDDILWRRASDGRLAIWDMEDGVRSEIIRPGTVPTTWEIEGQIEPDEFIF
jgi:Ca2+-binding RTX toxin-like protein